MRSCLNAPIFYFARLVGAVVGFTLIGLGIAFYVKADIGSDPFTVLVLGISGKTGISVGRANLS